MADLGSTATEDTEEGEWLEQQRQAQQLHKFISARAAQGELLRGSLATSLRASTSSLWGQKAQQGCKQQQQVRPQRPSSAPGGMRRLSSSGSCTPGRRGNTAADWGSPRNSIVAPSSRAGQRPSSRPSSPSPKAPQTPSTARTPSPVRCSSPGCGVPSSRPSSAAGRLTRRGLPSPHSSKQDAAKAAAGSSASGAKGGKGPGGGVALGGPWAPAIVEYRQQNVPIEKPWQVVNQLLVAAAEEDVVQELAGELGGPAVVDDVSVIVE